MSADPTVDKDRVAVVKAADMSIDMQQDAVDCANAALFKYDDERDVAAYIKKEFDKKYHNNWHCIVGRGFGSYVAHKAHSFVYFFLGEVAVMLWSC